MRALKNFEIRKADSGWSYIVEIEDDAGGRLQLTASFEALDQIAAATDREFTAVIEAAERLEKSNN
jgi:hypothetical protein